MFGLWACQLSHEMTWCSLHWRQMVGSEGTTNSALPSPQVCRHLPPAHYGHEPRWSDHSGGKQIILFYTVFCCVVFQDLEVQFYLKAPFKWSRTPLFVLSFKYDWKSHNSRFVKTTSKFVKHGIWLFIPACHSRPKAMLGSILGPVLTSCHFANLQLFSLQLALSFALSKFIDFLCPHLCPPTQPELQKCHCVVCNI